MRSVTFTRDMRPYRARQSAPLPDDVAQRLVEEGAARDNGPWPADSAAPLTIAAETDLLREPARRIARYRTK